MKATQFMAIVAIILMAFAIGSVAASADNAAGPVISKYAKIDPGYATVGQIAGQLRCGDNLMTTGVTITGPGNVTVPMAILPDGTFYLSDVSPGHYVINIADGNGGQPESAAVDVRAGYTSFPESELLGHAVTGGFTHPGINIISATYGDPEGTMADVTGDVQAVINNGQTVFMFNNGMNPGGIVAIDESAVYAAIEDPAYGVVKTVNIQYTTDDQPNVIHVMEYETITI